MNIAELDGAEVSCGLIIFGSDSTPAQSPGMGRSARAAIALGRLRLVNGFEVATLRADETACRYALAAGAIRACGSSLSELRKVAHEVTLLGGDLGGDTDLIAAELAEAWDATLIFDVLDIQKETDHWQIVRDGGRGAREILCVTGRVVLVISPESQARLYVSHHRRRSVRVEKAAIVGITTGATNEVLWEPAQPRAKTGSLAAKNQVAANDRMLDAFGITESDSTNAASNQVIEADPQTCAEHLLRYLAHHGFIDRRRVSERILKATTPTPEVELSDSSAINQTITPESNSGMSARIQRGPRMASDDPRRTRRPRALGEGSSGVSNLLPQVARRPRAEGTDRTRQRRGPHPLP